MCWCRFTSPVLFLLFFGLSFVLEECGDVGHKGDSHSHVNTIMLQFKIGLACCDLRNTSGQLWETSVERN